jgi:hypothetical protein
MERIGNINAVERFVFKFTRKLSGVYRIALVHFFFVGGRHICRVDNDAIDVVLSEDSQCPESAEPGFVDDMIDAVGIMLLQIGKQFQRRWVHREGFEFQAVETYGNLPAFQVCINTNEEVNVGKRNVVCGIHKIFPYV